MSSERGKMAISAIFSKKSKIAIFLKIRKIAILRCPELRRICSKLKSPFTIQKLTPRASKRWKAILIWSKCGGALGLAKSRFFDIFENTYIWSLFWNFWNMAEMTKFPYKNFFERGKMAISAIFWRKWPFFGSPDWKSSKKSSFQKCHWIVK